MNSPVHHRWSFDAQCARCETVHEVQVIEDAGPPFTDLPRRSYKPSTAFSVTEGPPVIITCLKCSNKFASPR